MKATIITTIISIFFMAHSLKAQQPEVHLLDLETSIAIAKMSSYDMLILRQDIKMAEFNLKAANSSLKTHIDLSLDAPDFSQGFNTFEDSTGVHLFETKNANGRGELSIWQPLITDGRISINSGYRGVYDFLKNDASSNALVYSNIAFVQPLDAFYGYNNIKSAFKNAKLNYERSQKRLTREELNLVYNVSSSFYNMVSIQKRVDFANQNLNRQKEAYEIAQNKYEVGLIREVDALQMEVDLAEAQNNYDISMVNLHSASNLFKELIGLPINDSIKIKTEIKYIPVMVNIDKALTYAKSNRLELREQDISIELQEMNIQRQKSQGMISADINAHYGISGINSFNGPDSYADEALVDDYLNNFNRSINDYGISLSVNIPILDWGENRARVNMAKAQLQQNIYQKEVIERRIEREIRNLVANYLNSVKRVQLLEKNLEVAEKSFNITLSRYSDGDIDSQALALERDRLNNAYLSHLSAYITYELNLADLMRKTYYNFKAQKPLF